MRNLFIALAIFSSPVLAVDYVLPDDGWYQLQQNTVTVCQTGDVLPCDVEAGIYVLINHTTGVRNESLKISEQSKSPGFEIVYQPATAAQVFTGGFDRFINVPCPTGTVIVGGSCSLTDNNVFEPYNIEAENYISATSNSLVCGIVSQISAEADLHAVAACAVGTATTLPTIVVK